MSKIKEILCLHHSHLDVGYTHPQNMLMELQCDYIDQAITLCESTLDWDEMSRFRWTCEATYPLEKWFETASESKKAQFKRLVKCGSISVAALPMHTTPGCSYPEMVQMLHRLDEMREKTGSEITCAINHDVNGQPWTLAPLLLDSGVNFYITGINIHFGGIPFPRPYAFRWQTQDGRYLTNFLGEHYSLFSQFLSVEENCTKKMHEGITKYVQRIDESIWPYDFVYLTATNPPLLDNNCPDAQLADLIRRYNSEGHEQVVRFVTPEQLYAKLKLAANSLDNLPSHSGDWTDYWNFGCASTARETKVNRHAKKLLANADFLECAFGPSSDVRYKVVRDKAWKNAVLYDEHTWGAAQSVQQPDCEETIAQELHKKSYAYNAAEYAAYALGRRMEAAADNIHQANIKNGVIISNPTAYSICQEIHLPAYLTNGDTSRTLAAQRIKEYLPYRKDIIDSVYCGYIQVPPCTVRTLPFSHLDKTIPQFTVTTTEISTPYYRVSLDVATGRIKQIVDRILGQPLLSEDSEWGFFEPIVERVDPRYATASRSSIFPRDVDLGNRNITQWQHDWRASREGITQDLGHETIHTETGVTLIYKERVHGTEWLERRITFSALHNRIQMQVTFKKLAVSEPDSLYFAFPLQLNEGWSCAYDTAGTIVKLDDEQLGAVCRDYITVDKAVSMYDSMGGVTLACPDAPLVQIAGFQFGRENRTIERRSHPLLLAWPLNNYWDTNFAISQEGVQQLNYELTSFATFSPQSMNEAGVLATNPCAVGSSLDCNKDESKQLILCSDRNIVPLFFMPCSDNSGWISGLKNLTNNSITCTIETPLKPLSILCLSNPQGKQLQELAIKNKKYTISIPANATMYIHCKERI